MDFKCVFLFSWFKFVHLLPFAFIVVTLLSAEFISKRLLCMRTVLFSEEDFSDHFILFLLKFLNNVKCK